MNQRFGRNLLYSLKRRYGTPGDLYHVTNIVDDMQTGQTTLTRVKYPIKKVIFLPVKMTSEVFLAGAYTRDRSHSHEAYDINTRLIIIAKADLPEFFQFGADDYFITHPVVRRKRGPGKRHNIQKIEELEDGVSVLITAIYAEGGAMYEIHDLSIKQKLSFIELNMPKVPEEIAGLPGVLPLSF